MRSLQFSNVESDTGMIQKTAIASFATQLLHKLYIDAPVLITHGHAQLSISTYASTYINTGKEGGGGAKLT